MQSGNGLEITTLGTEGGLIFDFKACVPISEIIGNSKFTPQLNKGAQLKKRLDKLAIDVLRAPDNMLLLLLFRHSDKAPPAARDISEIARS